MPREQGTEKPNCVVDFAQQIAMVPVDQVGAAYNLAGDLFNLLPSAARTDASYVARFNFANQNYEQHPNTLVIPAAGLDDDTEIIRLTADQSKAYLTFMAQGGAVPKIYNFTGNLRYQPIMESSNPVARGARGFLNFVVTLKYTVNSQIWVSH